MKTEPVDTRPFYRANPADRFIRLSLKPGESIDSEAIWDEKPKEAPPKGTRFIYKKSVSGYILVYDDGTVFTLIIHQ